MTDAKRRYRQTYRAEKTENTRQRIIEAAMDLHGTVGPARTSLSEVADRAGVSRPTLYAHFSREGELFRACTMHWISLDPLPDPSGWLEIVEPRDRVESALSEIYAHFERNEEMTANVLRDMYLVPSMRDFNVPLVEGAFSTMAQILAGGFDDELAETVVRRQAAASVAIDFNTWRRLIRSQRLTHEAAVDLMTDLVVRSS